MVRKATVRKKKYESNVDPDVTRDRIAAQKHLMVDLESEYFPAIAEVERKVKRHCEAAGVTSFQIAQYINVGRQCYSLAKRFSSATRDAEAQYVVNHWASRGLDGPLLALACRAGGCEVTEPAAACYTPCVHGSDVHDATVLDTVAKMYGPLSAAGMGPTAYNVFKVGDAYNSIISGTVRIFIYAPQYMNFFFENFPPTLNDEVQYKFSHKQGNYTFTLRCITSSDSGIISIYVDGVLQGTIDLYSPGTVANVLVTLAISILTDGEHTLNIKVASKNPSATNYRFLITAWWLRD